MQGTGAAAAVCVHVPVPLQSRLKYAMCCMAKPDLQSACSHSGVPEAVCGLTASTSYAAECIAGCRHPLHGPQGPLQGLLTDIMASAERSPQLLAAAAVRLCGLWVQHPARALSYVDVWERLLLSGGASAAPLHAVRTPTASYRPSHALTALTDSPTCCRITSSEMLVLKENDEMEQLR